MEDFLIAAVIFFGFYHIFKLISDHLLRRKIIKTGHLDKAGILDPVKVESDESNRYPSLKWGLVAFSAGLGLILIEVIRQINPDMVDRYHALLPTGIVLVFIAIGFLAYFFIANRKK